MRLPAKRGVAFTLSYRLVALNPPRTGGAAFNLPQKKPRESNNQEGHLPPYHPHGGGPSHLNRHGFRRTVAHAAREPHFFDALSTPEEIDRAASAWAASLPVTRGEVARACRYAALGFDDAKPAEPGAGRDPRFRADRSAAAKNLAALEDRLARACAALHATPDELKCETPSRLERLCEAAAVELGKPLTRNEPQLRADYDLTLREIRRRLKKGADNDR